MIRRVAIDIGHADGTGARGNGHEEHALCTVIGTCLHNLLMVHDIYADIIDYPDVDNSEDLRRTAAAANKGDYDLGVSLHCDASASPAAHGAHVCYLSTAGRDLATAIAARLCRLMPGRADHIVRRDDLYILRHTRPVWSLIECGFVTSSIDSQILYRCPETIAREIALGIEAYLATLP